MRKELAPAEIWHMLGTGFGRGEEYGRCVCDDVGIGSGRVD